ncbi:MAG: hypothetical protein ACLFVQ_09710 [Chitinispirillaceae bacterium]
MESAALVLTASTIVVILQIITIALVLSNKKQNRRNTKENRPNTHSGHQRAEKRDNRRNSRKPNQDNRSRPNQQKESASIDPVEKSLRDINLKLKNAERDQEHARRKMQENPSDNGEKRNDRNDRRGNRRNNNRRDRKNNNQDRRNRDSRSNGNTPEASEKPSDFRVKNEVSPKVAEPAANAKPDTPELIPNDLGVSEENLQHGRKFAVKRRQLSEENSNKGSESIEDVISKDDKIEVEFDSRPVESEIKFGRR